MHLTLGAGQPHGLASGIREPSAAATLVLHHVRMMVLQSAPANPSPTSLKQQQWGICMT